MRFISLILLLLISSLAKAQLNADFSASATQGCASFTVQFKDNSTGGATSWFWDFGNGQTSALQNPSATYTTSGKYTVRLIVKNGAAQNYEEKSNFITVFAAPEVGFVISGADSGCISLSTSFKDASTISGASIQSWSWAFGDGGTSTQQNPAYVFKTAGIFDVSLTIQSSQGCSATSTVIGAVKTGVKPVVSFTVSPLNGCASLLRNFRDKTTGSASAYLWDFGDKTTTNERSPQHHYQDTGFFAVKLKVSDNGCVDSAETTDSIHVDGAAARLNIFADCNNRLSYTFKDLSVAETGRLWDFNDGQTSTSKSVTHTFAAPGIYYVKLSVTGTPCGDSIYDTLHVQTGKPKINLIPKKDGYCRNDSLLFFVSGYDSVAARAFSWNFRDGMSTGFSKRNDSVDYVYKKNGDFKPILSIKNIDNCTDDFVYENLITIDGPTAQFNNDDAGCTNTTVSFVDKSAPGKKAPIDTWLWSYGDGTMANIKGPLKYTYSFPGTFNANLTVTDVNKCTDTITHTVAIFSAPTIDAGKDTFACAGSTVNLTAIGAANYSWQNSVDLSCTNCANPAATPQQSATYFVTGTTDGCSATDSVHIEVQTKQLVKVESNTYAVCSGGNSVMLNASGADNYSWSPSATLSNAFVPNPVAFPSTNTTYTVTAKDNRNCFTDMATVDVIVNDKPSVVIADSIVNIMIGSTFTILGSVGSDITSYQWIPPTGLSCTNCLNPTVTVRGNAQYTLAGINEFGCTDSAVIKIFAACTSDGIFIPNTFSPNNDGMNDYFYPRSVADINVKSFNVFNRWGQLLFQGHNFPSNNAKYGWNGKYNNQLQASDVYIYIMELQCSGSKSFIKKGNITLMR